MISKDSVLNFIRNHEYFFPRQYWITLSPERSYPYHSAEGALGLPKAKSDLLFGKLSTEGANYQHLLLNLLGLAYVQYALLCVLV